MACGDGTNNKNKTTFIGVFLSLTYRIKVTCDERNGKPLNVWTEVILEHSRMGLQCHLLDPRGNKGGQQRADRAGWCSTPLHLVALFSIPWKSILASTLSLYFLRFHFPTLHTCILTAVLGKQSHPRVKWAHYFFLCRWIMWKSWMSRMR